MKDYLPFLTVIIPNEVYLTNPPKNGFRKRLQKFRKPLKIMETRSVSGLADLVDVTGEVDHLVGEAPLVIIHSN
jgi:hypothetical protein